MLKKILKKLKPIGVLLFMTLLCLLIVMTVNVFKKNTKVPYIQNISNQEISKEESVIDTFEIQDVGSVEDMSKGSVLAAGDSPSKFVCPSSTVKIESQSVCTQTSSTGVNYTGGVKTGSYVKKSSTITLSRVKVPLELYSGMDVKDSNRSITSQTPTFKAAGEQIDEITVSTQLPPNTQVEEYTSWQENKPFSTSYSLTSAEGENIAPSNEGELGVDKKLVNNCEHCNNESNINPSKSNAMSTVMYNKVYRTPGEANSVTEKDVIESCDSSATFEVWDSDNYDGCYLSIVERAIALIASFSDSLWNNCQANPNSGDCISTEDIIIIMTSPFGSEEDCIGTTCTNAYMNIRNNSALAPLSNKEGKFYYTTTCYAIIEGREFPIKCAWDMSHLYKERKVSELDDLPGIESTPTKEEYNKFLLEQVKDKRGAAIQLQ